MMKVIKTIKEFRHIVKNEIGSGKQHGFVPTMGYLHNGHIKLMKEARKECDFVTTSIFVNPKQFGPKEDLAKYPRNIERDLQLMKSVPVDYVFIPSEEEMYPKGFRTFVDLEDIDKTREGRARPGHFRGVATVVTKLFNIVQPTKAYFGQKDGMQCIVIKRFTEDLNIPVDIVTVPTEREPDGLAMSSRNTYLSPQERLIAPVLYKALSAAKKSFHEQKVRDSQSLIDAATKVISTEPAVKLDYLDICDLSTGSEIKTVEESGAMLSGAILVGKTRLIDNIILKDE